VDTKDQTLEEVLKRGLNFQPRTWVTVRLTSVLRLRKECADKSDPLLGEMFKDVKFVGKLSENHLLFQHNIGLYCVNIPRISELMFYQLFLHYFHNLEEFVLDPPIKLEMKLEKLQMMKEYFSIHIDEDSGRLVRLPVVIKGHKPNLSRIDRFIEDLANPDIWDDEMVCFRAIITALSQLYKVDDLSVFSDLDFLIDQLKLIKIPGHVFSDGDIKELASLSNLYKIFERC
jgi:DNA mismatch repair protein MLH1